MNKTPKSSNASGSKPKPNSKKSSDVKPQQSTPGPRKNSLINIADSTLEAMDRGEYNVKDVTYSLKGPIKLLTEGTIFYPADSELSGWSSVASESGSRDLTESAPRSSPVHITITECSTLVGARTLKQLVSSSEDANDKRIGVLNFASAKNPGGGFLTGAQAQEESLARSSTIYAGLIANVAKVFFRNHKRDPMKGYYSHAMLYLPHVLLFRSDTGDWLPPVEVDIVSSAAINAGVVRRYLRERRSTDESELDASMKERMARILYLFEKKGIRNLVLGSFGTGVFRNRVELVAAVWKELLIGKNARFRHSFDRVEFSILGNSTYSIFESTFAENGHNEG